MEYRSRARRATASTVCASVAARSSASTEAEVTAYLPPGEGTLTRWRGHEGNRRRLRVRRPRTLRPRSCRRWRQVLAAVARAPADGRGPARRSARGVERDEERQMEGRDSW